MAVEHSPANSFAADFRRMNLELISSPGEAVEPETDSGLRMNESAFRAFYEQTATPLLRYLIGITRTPDLVEDVLQEAYCRFLTARLPDMDDRQTGIISFESPLISSMIGGVVGAKTSLCPRTRLKSQFPLPTTTGGWASGRPLTASNPASVSYFGSHTSKVPIIKKSPNTRVCNPQASACCCLDRAASSPHYLE